MRLTAHQPAPRWRVDNIVYDDAAAAAAATAITLTNASPNPGLLVLYQTILPSAQMALFREP